MAVTVVPSIELEVMLRILLGGDAALGVLLCRTAS
jgi:hypothetical protein